MLFGGLLLFGVFVYIATRSIIAAIVPIILVSLFFSPAYLSDGMSRGSPERTHVAHVYTNTGVLPEGAPVVRKFSLLDDQLQTVKDTFREGVINGAILFIITGIVFIIPIVNVFAAIAAVVSIGSHLYTYWVYVGDLIF